MDNSDVSPDLSAPAAPVPSAPPAPAVSSAAPAPVPVPSAPPAPVSTVVPTLDDVKQNIANMTQKVTEWNGGSTAVTSLMVGAAIAFCVAFVLYWVITRATNPIKKVTYMLPHTKAPQPGYEVSAATTEGMPTLKDAATVSFWIYVNEFSDVLTLQNNNTNTIYRHVWHRGDMKWIDNPENMTSLVLLASSKKRTEPQKNSLIVLFRSTNAGNPWDSKMDNTANIPRTTKINYMLGARGISIDYIPVKRWVHIAITVDKSSKVVKAYMDGQLVKSVDNRVSTTVRHNSTNVNVVRQFGTTDLNGAGDIHIGGRPTSDLGLGFPGLVSNIRFSNWAMSSSEIYGEYKKGPVDNLMAKLGLPAYSLQAPIYKIL